MRKLMLVLGLLSLPLMAQDRWEVFGGYQYSRLSNIFDSGVQANANGVDVSLTAHFLKHFGMTADGGAAYKTVQGVNTRLYTYTGGPVAYMNFGKFRPFIHVVAGGTLGTLSSTSGGVTGKATLHGLCGYAGGGIDWRVKKRIAVRVIQADWLYYHFEGYPGINLGDSFNESKNLRFSAGVVYRF